MSVLSPPPKTNETLPPLLAEQMSKSHVRVRKLLATVDRSLGKIALAYGLQYCALDVVAHSFLRLGRAVEGALRREERYLQSLVRKTENDSCRQQTCNGDEPDERRPDERRSDEQNPDPQTNETEQITSELRFLRQVTNDFVAPNDACRSYHTLMTQLEEMESVLYAFTGETD